MGKKGEKCGWDKMFTHLFICSNHMTYVILLVLIFALMILLGDMMYYFFYFMKNTFYSCFSQKNPKEEIVVPFEFATFGKIKYMNKMYFRKED